MRNRPALLIALTGALLAALPAGSAAALLLGNHQITLDLLGTTQYFDFAEFKEYEFPEQGLDWGFRLQDLYDIENWDPDIPDGPLENRNLIKLGLAGNLDLGLRVRTAIRPRWGIEGYFKYTPVDLIITYNGQNLSEASFTRYSGVTNPENAENEDLLNWVVGDYPTYHVIRFGANLDYVFYRGHSNQLNLYAAVGGGVVSYRMSGDLYVPTDYPEEQEVPSAPANLSYLMPNDTFPSANLGLGGIFFLHRLFGINVDLRASYSPFEMKRVDSFDTSKQHWIYSASIGYTFRLG